MSMLDATTSPSRDFREKKLCFQPSIGSIVNIQSRTWPGINKPGGVGRITAVHYEKNEEDKENTKVTHVDVKYIVNGGSETNVDFVFVREYHLHGAEGKERSRRAKIRTVERSILQRKNPEKKHENKQCSVKFVTSQFSIKKRKNHSNPEITKTNSRPSCFGEEWKMKQHTSSSSITLPSITSAPVIEATDNSQNMPCFLKRVNVLKGLHEDMSFNAAKFVDGIVGQSPIQQHKFACFSSAKKIGQQNTNEEKHHSYLLDENPVLDLQVKEKRKRKFTHLLNKVMQNLMIDELQIEDMLNKINTENDERHFSELEARCYLTALEELNRIMISWDSKTIYRI